MHSFEQLHGVYVRCDGSSAGAAEGATDARASRCARFSLIVWIHEGQEQCKAALPVSGVEAMMRRSAEEGVAEGQYEYAKLLLQGHWGGAPTASTRHRAVALLEEAASQHNHSAAALQLGKLWRDDGEQREAARWFRWSAELGHPIGRREVADLDAAALDAAGDSAPHGHAGASSGADEASRMGGAAAMRRVTEHVAAEPTSDTSRNSPQASTGGESTTSRESQRDEL